MFTVEFVIVQGREFPRALEKIFVRGRQISGAIFAAKSQFEIIRQKHSQTPPDGYQIVDIYGDIVLRSWEKTQHG